MPLYPVAAPASETLRAGLGACQGCLSGRTAAEKLPKGIVQTAGEGISLWIYMCPWLTAGGEDHEAPDLPTHPYFHPLGGKCLSPSGEKDTPTSKVSKQAA